MSLTLARTVAEGFDPRAFPGLQAYYDARYPLGFGVPPPGVQTGLSRWSDLSGKNNDNIQNTSASRPLWVSGKYNLIDPTLTTLVGGATYNTSTGEYTLNSVNQKVSFWAKLNGNSNNWYYSEDGWGDTNSPNVGLPNQPGILRNLFFFGADKVTPAQNTAGLTSNGSAVGTGAINTWKREQTTVIGGPNVVWVRVDIAYSTVWSVGTIKMRAPVIQYTNNNSTFLNVAPIGPNASPCLIFDGNDDYMSLPWNLNGGNPTPCTYYAAYQGFGSNLAQSVSQALCFSSPSGVGGNRSGLLINNINSAAMYGKVGGVAALTLSTPGTTHVVSGVGDGIDTQQIKLDGGPNRVAAALGATYLTGFLNLGGSNNGVTTAFYGAIFYVLIYSILHDLNTRRRIENGISAIVANSLIRP